MSETLTPQTVGIQEAARLLNTSPKTIRSMIKRGDLIADKVQGKYGPEYQIAVPSLTAAPTKPIEETPATSPATPTVSIGQGRERVNELSVISVLHSQIEDLKKDRDRLQAEKDMIYSDWQRDREQINKILALPAHTQTSEEVDHTRKQGVSWVLWALLSLCIVLCGLSLATYGGLIRWQH